AARDAPDTRRKSPRGYPAPPLRHAVAPRTRAAAAGLRSDDSSIVLQCRADPGERRAHWREDRAERSAEPVCDLLKREAGLLPELHHLPLRGGKCPDRVADGGSQLSLEQSRVSRSGDCGLSRFQRHRSAAPDELASQVV